MAIADYYISKNDTLPVISATLENADGSIVDLTGGTYQFLITNADTGATVIRTATLNGLGTLGNLQYQWVAADTTVPGLYRCKWVVTFGGSAPMSFPNNDYILVQVYAGPPGQILTSRADYDAVRDYLGVTVNDLSDSAIEGSGFLPMSEAFIISKLAVQTNCPTVVQIMAGTTPATSYDKTFLKAAIIYRIAYHFAIGETSAVDTAISVGSVTKDLGGIGAQWVNQREEALKDCDQALGSITGFKRWRTL
ncbi:MAG: hypothetical protein H0X33_13190 [Taibaiella sp.]|nr:hypothetical protein [Taibaiella sp.]